MEVQGFNNKVIISGKAEIGKPQSRSQQLDDDSSAYNPHKHSAGDYLESKKASNMTFFWNCKRVKKHRQFSTNRDKCCHSIENRHTTCTGGKKTGILS